MAAALAASSIAVAFDSVDSVSGVPIAAVTAAAAATATAAAAGTSATASIGAGTSAAGGDAAASVAEQHECAYCQLRCAAFDDLQVLSLHFGGAIYTFM